jgi:hypothetical protein
MALPLTGFTSTLVNWIHTFVAESSAVSVNPRFSVDIEPLPAVPAPPPAASAPGSSAITGVDLARRSCDITCLLIRRE